MTSVFDQLLEAVHRGELKPGQRISDADIADEFGVSRTPVREALQRLREIGIVEASPSRFTRIADVSPRQTIEALVVWVALYGALLDEVVPEAKDDWVEELEGYHREYNEGIAKQDADTIFTANYRFYNVLVEKSSNLALQRSINGVVHIVRLGAHIMRQYLDPQTLGKAQQELIDAVRNHDVAAARASLDTVRSIEVPLT